MIHSPAIARKDAATRTVYAVTRLS